MANRAYASVWCREARAESLLRLYEGLLGTLPYSAARPGITSLVIRAVGPDEAPLAEHDLRAAPLAAAEVAEFAREYEPSDCAFETQAHWDLWVYDLAGGKWEQKAERVEIFCYGPKYDGGTPAAEGHFQIDAGFEHFFTGHGGVLGANGAGTRAQHPLEEEFLRQMSDPVRLQEYGDHTRDNIRKLIRWMEAIQHALPVERLQLGSEGEENFEARLDDILAMR